MRIQFPVTHFFSRAVLPAVAGVGALSVALGSFGSVVPVAHAQSAASSSLSSNLSSNPFGDRGSDSNGTPAPGPDAAPASHHREVLWSEDFDGVDNPAKFTHRVPEGWTSSSEGVHSGEARWNGWALSTIRDWTWAAGTDKRHYFTQAHDQLAIIDSEQQRLNDKDHMDASLVSPEVGVAGRDKVSVEFDHHYRQGDKGQDAVVSVSFDGSEKQELKVFDADQFSAHEAFDVEVPAGATSMQIHFDYRGGNNDYWWAVDNVSVAEPLGEVSGKPQAIIDVLSDTQDDNDDYRDAVKQLNAMPDKAGALVLNGDLVDNGSKEQWDAFMQAHKDTPHDSGKELWTIGNHEMHGDEGSETYMRRFLENSGQDKPWKEEVVDGVPLISVNTEYYSDIDRGGKEPFQRISQEQLDWLDSRLAYWDAKGTPALVFTHPLLPQTVSMSYSAWYQNDFEDLEAVSNVLNKYNNIVAFTSHSHSSLKQNNWWGVRRYDGTGEAGKRGFPVVNTGAVLNEFMPDGDHDEEIVTEPADHSTGLRVKVYDDRVRVEAWDFKKHKMMKFHDFAR